MWFCQTEEAKIQAETCNDKKCPGCRKCVWVSESANAMLNHGIIIEKEHPLLKLIIEKFKGTKIE